MAQRAWNDFEKLPSEAKRQVEDFITFLLERSKTTSRKRRDPVRLPLEQEPFVGIWKDRSDLDDSSQWVRSVREREWGG